MEIHSVEYAIIIGGCDLVYYIIKKCFEKYRLMRIDNLNTMIFKKKYSVPIAYI